MTEELSQDVTVEAQTQDVTVETPEANTEETESQDSPDVESEEGGEETPQETVEDRLERLERETAGKQKAIDRKTAAYHALQKKYESQMQEMQTLSQKVQETAPMKEPILDDFETVEEFDKARIDFRVNQAVKVKEQQFAQMQKQQQYQALQSQRTNMRVQQEAEYMKDNPLYKNSVSEVEEYMKVLNATGSLNPETSEAFAAQLYKGNVPQVIEYFGSGNGENLEELQNISQMSAPEAAVEVYKIQQKLSVNPVKNKETKPKPKPIKATGSGKTTRGLGQHSSGDDVLKTLGLKK